MPTGDSYVHDAVESPGKRWKDHFTQRNLGRRWAAKGAHLPDCLHQELCNQVVCLRMGMWWVAKFCFHSREGKYVDRGGKGKGEKKQSGLPSSSIAKRAFLQLWQERATLLGCTGPSWRWLLQLQSMSSRAHGFQWLQHVGSVVVAHRLNCSKTSGKSSQIRDWTRFFCIDR